MIDRITNNRRDFLKSSLAVCSSAFLYPFINDFSGKNGSQKKEFLKEAMFYDKLPNKKIQCKLCPRQCTIDELERGYCGVRENRDGVYYTLVHSQACTYHIDPIEKKPFFHFLPKSDAFSFATVGCNVECKFCQNWQISQIRPEQTKNYFLTPDDIAKSANDNKCKSIAYTYSEPVIYYEYMYDTILAGKKKGLKSVMISNGYINPEPLKKLCDVIDGIKIDLKAYTDNFYKKYVNGELAPVLKTIEAIKKTKVWLEIVYLVIPTLNDKESEFRDLARWLKSNIGLDTPVHFTRFYPQYKLQNLPSTPVDTLTKAKQICDDEGLHYVYVGNVPGHKGENTYCPKCKNIIIERTGYAIKKIELKSGKCGYCSNIIPGFWDK